MEVILVNGPAGVGKSTISSLLAARACISGDALKSCVIARSEHVHRFTGALRADVAVQLVTPWAPHEVVAAGGRAGPSWHAIHAALGELGTIVNATGTVTETLERVLAAVGSAS